MPARCPPRRRALGSGVSPGGSRMLPQAHRPRPPGAGSRSCPRRSPRSRRRPRGPAPAPAAAGPAKRSGAPARHRQTTRCRPPGGGRRREDVAAVEGRADDRSPEVAVGELACLDRPAQRVGGRQQQAVVGADEQVAPRRRESRSAVGRCRPRGRRRRHGHRPGNREGSRGGRTLHREPRTSGPRG